MARTLVRFLGLAAVGTALAACGGGSDSSPSTQGGGSLTGTQSLTLDWDPNTEPDLAGYKVYRSTVSGAYQTAMADVPAGTMTYTVNELQAGTTYLFVVTAYNSSFSESAHSNEVSKAF
jgi:hypothetical protein